MSPIRVLNKRCLITVHLLAMPMVLWAQAAPTSPPTDWKRANEAVAEFPRGHVDVLKWEGANTKAKANASNASNLNGNQFSALNLDQVTRLAWAAHRELAFVQARLGVANVALVEQGRWTEIDVSLQRRVKGMDELLEVAAQGRKAWLQAVAAQHVLTHRRSMVDAAEAALELGQRMVAVGNWSALQLTQVQLAKSTAHMSWTRAQYAAAQARAALLKTLRLAGMSSSVVLPDALPVLPARAFTEADVTQRLQVLQAHMPRAEGQLQPAVVQLAFEAYQASWTLAQGNQNEVLATRQFMVQETQLHYNGMLKSVWDLLAEVNNQSQAAIDAVNAQRDALMADIDLNWVLQGGSPASFVSLSGTSESAPAAGH